MKMRAGGQFQHQEARARAGRDGEQRQQRRVHSRRGAISTALDRNTNVACDAARPSMPSMKLKRLMLHNTASISTVIATVAGKPGNTDPASASVATARLGGHVHGTQTASAGSADP